MSQTLRNIMPYSIHVRNGNGIITLLITERYQGNHPKIAAISKNVEEIKGMPIFLEMEPVILGLPEPEGNTFFVVEEHIAKHPLVATRRDLLYPGRNICDVDGQLIGCYGLRRTFE